MSEGVIYFVDGEVVAESGDVKVYKMNEELFLEIGPGHNLWALESESVEYIRQLWDKPRGNVLEIGLGLGIASRCILTYPKVEKLTTVEINEDVIKIHEKVSSMLDDGSRKEKWLPYNSSKHKLVNVDGLIYMYKTSKKFDFIFLDAWSHIDEDTLPFIADMVRAARNVLKKDGEVVGWFDPYTPNEFGGLFHRLFEQ
jgi:spermidine synthase